MNNLAANAAALHSQPMRTVSSTASVRLYYLDESDPVAQTLFYGPLSEAMALARRQSEDVQAGLWFATENDVVPFLDMDEG